jgi:two-component system response regulator ChvI
VLLTVTEFKLVDFLATRVGQDVGYRELYDIVRGAGFVAGYGEDGFRSNVRAFVKRIRRKFRDVDDSFDEIESYSGFGYRWREREATDS